MFGSEFDPYEELLQCQADLAKLNHNFNVLLMQHTDLANQHRQLIYEFTHIKKELLEKL